jgi:hypothetical protein
VLDSSSRCANAISEPRKRPLETSARDAMVRDGKSCGEVLLPASAMQSVVFQMAGRAAIGSCVLVWLLVGFSPGFCRVSSRKHLASRHRPSLPNQQPGACFFGNVGYLRGGSGCRKFQIPSFLALSHLAAQAAVRRSSIRNGTTSAFGALQAPATNQINQLHRFVSAPKTPVSSQ